MNIFKDIFGWLNTGPSRMFCGHFDNNYILGYGCLRCELDKYKKEIEELKYKRRLELNEPKNLVNRGML